MEKPGFKSRKPTISKEGKPVKAEATKARDANESSEGTAEDGQSKPRIQSAVRTISVLLAVADSPNGLKAKEIVEKLGLSRQVTHRLIHTMHGTGIILKARAHSSQNRA
jgi:hypothetical protein